MKGLTQQCIMREGMTYSFWSARTHLGILEIVYAMNFDRRFKNEKSTLSVSCFSIYWSFSGWMYDSIRASD